jgi:hypothetical protein
MLGTIVLLACVAASGVVGCILFVVVGPVPVKRRVTMVSRIQPLPLPVTAAPIMIEAPVGYAPPIAPFEPPSDLQFTPPPPPPRRRAHAVDGPVVAPRVIRRPRSEPSPLPRTRAARGTQGRSREFDSIEVTHRESPTFDADDHTTVEPAFS